MLLIVLVIECAMVDLPHDAVGGVGRTEHEVAEQSQLCVKLLVVLGDVSGSDMPLAMSEPEQWKQP
jgi:hypothetical protein